MLTSGHLKNNPRYAGLEVNKGVSVQPMVNPHLHQQRVQREDYPAERYIEEILAGNRTFLTRAMTLVENTRHDHQLRVQQILEGCLPYSGQSMYVDITGVPGAGRSTPIDAFGVYLIKQGHKLAVLAIGPSNEIFKGSILGDETRMERLSRKKHAFIRPSVSNSSLDGMARKMRETIALCETAGFDTVFVEMVGVGQSEMVVHSMINFLLLIQLADTSDGLQDIKRDIMKMADGIIISKADGDNVDKTHLVAQHFRDALQLFPATEPGWEPKIMTYSGLKGIGTKEVFDMIDTYRQTTKESGYFEYSRRRQEKWRTYETVNEEFRHSLYDNEQTKRLQESVKHEVLGNHTTPFVGAGRLLEAFYKSLK